MDLCEFQDSQGSKEKSSLENPNSHEFISQTAHVLNTVKRQSKEQYSQLPLCTVFGRKLKQVHLSHSAKQFLISNVECLRLAYSSPNLSRKCALSSGQNVLSMG